MTAATRDPDAVPSLRVDYSDQPLPVLLAADDTLLVIGFGSDAPRCDDPRYLHVALEPFGDSPFEVWHAGAPVTSGRDGVGDEAVAWSVDGALQFGAMELDEIPPAGLDAGRDIETAAAAIYTRMAAFNRARGYPHLLRVWNYFDGITSGDDDAERYRRFCSGRARGIGDADPTTLPAATAIGMTGGGRENAPRRLQVYWLAARAQGTPVENPRQLSAYRYPRQYGPQPPSFARAMLPASAAIPLLLSGTAAVVGHESRHADCVAAQLDETLRNFDSLLDAARARRPQLSPEFGPHTRLKVYVRDQDDLAQVAALLRTRLGASVPCVVLHAAICRRELRLEIDGVHG